MKRLAYTLLSLCVILVLVSCDANTPTTPNADLSIETKNTFEFYASSVQDFVDQYALNPVQNTTFVLAVNMASQTFENYTIKYIMYTPVQTDKGTWNGSIYSDVYWHDVDCSSYSSLCEVFKLRLVYHRDGTNLASATRGLNQTDNPNFYTAEINFNKTAYVYIINDQYYCRYVINNDLSDKELIEEQLALFCAEIEDALEGNN